MAKKKQDEQHYFANDGSDWKTQPSPVDPEELRKVDKEFKESAAQEGQGPSATNGR